jgi:hypothetical protein
MAKVSIYFTTRSLLNNSSFDIGISVSRIGYYFEAAVTGATRAADVISAPLLENICLQ